MQPNYLVDAEEWLLKADEDLLAGEVLLASQAAVLGTIVFLAQQAGEKALKGFLTAYGRTFPKTHELERLLPDCIALNPGFAAFQLTAPRLSTYAVDLRYPSPAVTPAQADASRAIEMARDILTFVRQALIAVQQTPPTSP
jgi:HEPN domain-containing protein